MKINRNHPTNTRRQGRDSYSEETIDEEGCGYGHSHGRGSAFKSEGGDDEADMELRYRALYEQKMNPFAEVSIYPWYRTVQYNAQHSLRRHTILQNSVEPLYIMTELNEPHIQSY